jgi:hypothetical protein
MHRPNLGRHRWIVIVVAVLATGWLLSASLAALIGNLFFSDGFLIAPP